jgi:predicted DsbA family dithiol-disulfide isomerase
MTNLELDVVSDLICPWCFIGATRIQQALAQLPDVQATLVYHPFLLDPTVPPEGIDLRERLRKKYGRDPEGMFDRVEAAARESGIPIDYTRIQRTPNTIAGHTLMRHAGAHGTQGALAMALFNAYFLEGKDIGKVDVLTEIAAAHGFTEDEARSIATDPSELARTRTEAATWAREGVSGVPFTIVGKKVALSGAQPVDVFVEAMRRAVAAA